MRTYCCGLGGQRLATRLLCLLIFTFSALTTALILVFVIRTLALLARLFPILVRRVAGKRADHQIIVRIFEVEAVAVEVVHEWAFLHPHIAESICGCALLWGGEEGGVDVVGGILELRVARGTIMVYARREDVVGVLVIRSESGKQKILLCCVEVEWRAILEVVGGASHRDSWCGVQRKENEDCKLEVVLRKVQGYSLDPFYACAIDLEGSLLG
jgi:hypothetical protein